MGRGTFVTVRHLEVLRLHDGRFVSMLDVPMDEYLWSSTARDPVLLCRRLSVYEGQRGAILQLRLDPLDLGGQSLPKDPERPVFTRRGLGLGARLRGPAGQRETWACTFCRISPPFSKPGRTTLAMCPFGRSERTRDSSRREGPSLLAS